jgi:tripartite-type tricarboxylate transporter receptor subunit TctC
MVTGGVGSGSDFVARLIAPELSASLGQPMIVDNRGSGVIPGEIVAKAPPDGYTLLLYGNAMWLAPFMQDRVAYDVTRDFSPVSLTTTTPNILVVQTTLPVNSVKELIALAKARPGELNYGSGPAGSLTHLAAELFKVMAGVNVVRINYKGVALAINDLLAGQVQLMFPTPATVMPHIKSGRLKALAVTSASPSALVPGVPTIASSGLPGYTSVAIQGVFAPAATPAPIINRLNEEIVRLVNRANMKEKLLSTGVEAVGSSPAQLAAAVKSEMASMGKVIKDAGIRGE